MDNIFDSFQAELKDLGEGKEDWWNNNLSDITEDEEDNEKDNGGTEINFLKKQKEEEEDADDSKTDVRPESPELKRSFKKLKKMKFSNVLKLVDGTSNKVNSDLNQTCKTITSKNKSGSSESNDIGSNIQSLVGEQNEFSWSSTLASPLSTSVVNYSNLNSEEKQTLIPTCFNTAETSELFTSDYNESKCSDMCDNSVVKYSDYNTGNKQVFLDEINDEVEDCISETCNKQPVGFEKKCSRKLRFSSPKGQVRHSKDVKNMDRCLGNNLDKTTCEDLSDKDSSPDINILENFVSPISRTLMQNLDKDENFGSNKFRVSEGGITYSGVINENFNTHCQNNENYIKSSAKIFDSSSSNKSNVDNLSADLSISPQDQSNDISLRALEEICQASEILTTSCYSSTPLSSKKFVKNICTSTPIDESYKIIERKKCVMNKLNENKLENYSVKFKVPNKSPLKIVSDTEKKLSTDSLPEPSDKVNTLITLSHEPMKNSLSIYSILSRNITPSCNCKSLNDVLLSAKLLEDAECNRSSSQYIKKNKNALNEIIDKGNGFLQFNSLEMLESETSKLNDVESLLISKIKIADDDKYHLSNQYNDEEMLSKRFNHISNVMSTRNCDITNYSEVTDTQMFRIGEEAESNDTCSKYSISDTQMFRAVEEIDNILEVVNYNNDDINNIFDEKEIKESTNYIKSNSEKSCVNREPTLKKNHFKHEDPTENSTCSTIPYNKPDISNGKSHNSLKTFKISKLNEDCMTMEESFIEKNFIDSEFTQLSTFENLGNECLNDKKIIEKDKCLQVLSSNETKNITEDVSLKQKLYFGYNLLNDYSVEDGHEKLADRNEHSVDKCSVFFTASGKSVKVSDEALFKVRNMFFGSNELICRSDSSENSKKSVSCELSNLKTLDSCSHITSHNHCDFSTASGKQVNISEDALLKAKQLLSEDSLKKFEDVSVSRSVIEETLPKNTKVKTFDIVLNKSSGFTTASGNKVNISKEALLKAKKFLETEIDYSESVDKLEEKIPKKGEVNNFAGFLATSEKCVNLSKEPVSKAKNLFENNDGSSGKSHELKTVAVHKKEYPSNFAGFSTASGKSVRISKEALSEAKKLFAEFNINNGGSDESKESIQHKNEDCNFFGFSSDCGQTTSLSKGALLKAKEDEENNDNSGSSNKLKGITHNKIKDIGNFSGFSTASGKSVSVSEESLLKVKKLFAEDNDNSGFTDELKESTLHSGKGVNNFNGFSTAGGKSINVSKKSLTNARKLFEDIAKDKTSSELKEQVHYRDEILNNFVGFSTTSGKSISLSKDALSEARKLFKDNTDKFESSTHFKENVLSHFDDFSNIDRKSIGISGKLLSNVGKLFEGDGEKSEMLVESKGKVENSFVGFSTASGKSVNVSKEALLKVKNLFADDNSLNDLSVLNKNCTDVSCKTLPDKKNCKSFGISGKLLSNVGELFEVDGEKSEMLVESKGKTENSFVGFSTASGKSVNVSKEALLKVKNLFADDNSLNDLSVLNKNCTDVSCKTLPDKKNCKSFGISGKLLSNVGELFEVDGEKSEMLVESKGKTENSFVGFSTASGKSVNVSKEALLKVKNLFADDNSLNDLSVLNKNCTDVSCKTLPDKKNCKSFGISGKLLSNVGELFEVDGEKSEMLVESKGKTENSFVGFSTASGKSVNVSKEALLKVKNLFADDNSLNDLSVLNKNCTDVSCQSLPDKKICKSFGFSTASGKSVIVSKNSLLRAKKIFEENNSSTGHATLLSCGGTSCLSVGNKTTEESCSVNGIIKDYSKFSTIIGNSGFTIKENFSETNRLHTESSTCYNKVFSTASGKPVNVSDESLSKVKNLFTNEDVKLTNIDCCSKNEKFTVSQRTATKSHKMSPYENTTFSNVNEKFPIKFSNCVSDSSFEGFKTANNKSIAVSNEALLKAKQLFMNENDVDLKLSLASIDDCQLSHIGEQLVPEISGNKFNITYDTKKNNFDPVTHLEKCDAENCRSSVFDEDVSLSFVHEISESAAAFLFDEDKNASDVPEWVQTFVTSPSCLNDRNMTKISPIISNEANESVKRKRVLSPVLGSNDRFKKKRCNAYKSLKKSSFLNNESPVNSKGGIFSRLSDSNASFKTSTPLNTDKINKKRLICDKSFSLPVLKKLKMVDNEIFSQEDGKLIHALDIAEGRRIAAEQQNDFILKYKNKELTKQCKGSLLFRKTTEKRISLFEYVHGMLPKKYSRQQLLEMGVKKSVIDVTSNNAVNFRFKASDYYDAEFCDKNIEGLPIGDGAMLILDGAGTAGIQEITRAFFASPNVCPSLISHQWVQNHYRWITWKLASMERSFPTTFTNVCLTPHNVMLQLKYRYDREIDACQRSALRKLLESDESSARRMVVCVSDISYVVEKNEIDLSDGWYSITTIIDNEMVELINRKKVVVGTKLIIQGAELINNDQGCDPLQVGENVRLRLHTNSARRVRWNTRLGFCKHSGPLPERLDSVLPKGGVIGRLDAIIARSYPLVYMKKSDDGKNVFLGMKAEERESRLRQQKIQQQIETVYSQIQKEVDSEKRKSNKRCYKQISSEEFQSILSPGKLIGITENSPDLCGILSKEQRDIIDKFYCEEREKMQQSLQERLKEQLEEIKQQTSIPLLKLRLVDHLNPSCRKWKSGILSIWKPSEDLQSYLSEGAVVSISNVLANGSRNGELQLNAGCQVKYSVKSHSDAVRRNVSPLSLLNDVTFKPQFMELDVVGIVIHIETLSSLQTAYITDSSKYLLGISFWGSIKDFGWEKIVSQGSFIACCNLQWRSGTASWHIPCAHVTEVSYFTLNPKHDSLCNAMKCLKKDLVSEDLSTLILESQEKLFFLLKQRESGGLNLKSNKISMDLVNSHNNSSDLICESLKSCNESFIATNVSNDAAMSNKKASLINQKLKKLESYGKPPPITELPVAVLSPLAKKQFKLPICRNNNNELKDSSTFTMANVSKNR